MSQQDEQRRKWARILSALSEAAERGATCPSNTELAKLVGYGRKYVGNVMSIFQDEGLIEIEVRGWKRRVTIVATGKTTAPFREPKVAPRRPSVTVGEMVLIAADVFDTPAKDIRSRARFRHIVRARQAVCIAASHAGWSASHIGRAFGQSHKSVLYARNMAEVWGRHDRRFAEGLARLEQRVGCA